MQKSIRAVLDVRPGEVLPTLLMSAYFFLVITSFWILKPIKKTLFIGYYDRHAPPRLWGQAVAAAELELVPKLLNVLVAFVSASLFVWLSARLRRERLSYVFAGAMLVALLGLTRVVNAPDEATVWTFYMFGDLFNMVMVATFFAFQNDLVSPELARRTYGLVGLGGVLGGVFGTTFVKARIGEFSTSTWLYICAASTLLVLGISAVVPRTALSSKHTRETHSTPVLTADARAGIAGARVVARSPYLVSIVSIVAIYEVVSTMIDFQFSATISHYLDGPAIGEQFATVFMVTNIASLFVQLVCTSWVMRNMGVRVALSILPLAVLLVSGGFVALPLLWVASSLSIADNALNYSVNQSAKESLYVPAKPVEKYQAKAFIDMFVQRFAKAVGVLLSFGMHRMMANDFGAVRYLSFVVLALAFAWLAIARYAGEQFDQMASAPAE